MMRDDHRRGRPLRLRRFKQHARRFWDAIPARFREGAVLMIHDEPNPDPELDEVYFFGMCEPAFAALEDAVAASGDPRPSERQSLVHVWYGSFAETAARARQFDWRGELEETILHELTHHWEHRAGLDGLDRFDAAQLINFGRLRGLAAPLYFWRDGEPDGDHAWIIDADRFVEVEGPPPWTVDPGDGGPPVTCEPDPYDGFATIPGRGAALDGAQGDLIVAPRLPERPTLWQRVRRLFGRDDE